MQQGMQSRDERSLGELFADLSRQTSVLIRQEVALAKAELSQKASTAGKNVGFIAAGGAVLYAGFLVILAAIVILLAKVVAWWLAALIVGVIVAVAGFVLIDRGLESLKKLNPVSGQTVETLKEDREWMKEQI